MGQNVYITAKDSKATKALNRTLMLLGIRNSFNTEKDNINWLKDINTNVKSQQRHLKPADRDLTLDELKQMFETWTCVNQLNFDVAFSRTDELTAQKYAQLIYDNKDIIESVKNGNELVSRYTLTDEQRKAILDLNIEEPEPEKLPKSEQHIPDLQSGLMLCKSWSDQPFWVVFGNVDSPRFMKTKIYADDLYNNLYRDKKGYAYLLIPLMPLNKNYIEFLEKVYSEAWQMGLRENPNYFLGVIYGASPIVDKVIVENMFTTYTPDEINERFNNTMVAIGNLFNYGVQWSTMRQKFVLNGRDNTDKIESLLSILTVLLQVMIKIYGRKEVAVRMSAKLNTKFHAVDFNE